MSIKYPAALLALLCISTQAHAFPLEIFENVAGNRVVAFIEESDIDKSIHWKPFDQAPPVTVEQATRAVFKHLGAEKDMVDTEIVEIELRPIPHHEDQWHYMVKMKMQNNDEVKYRYFIVLMNGKVIPAIREPDSIK